MGDFVLFFFILILFTFMMVGYWAGKKAGEAEGELRTFRIEHDSNQRAMRETNERLCYLSTDIHEIFEKTCRQEGE